MNAATTVRGAPAVTEAQPRRRVPVPPREVLLAALGVVAFIGMTVWWLTQEGRVQDWDNALHTLNAFYFHDWIAQGHLREPFTFFNSYPPFGSLIGALGVVFSHSPDAVIMADNLVFVPLLAAGCYGVGRLVYGAERSGARLAGLLAALFALGTPLIISEFHEVMPDPQQAAMVAVSVWAVLACDRFRRPWIALLAGVLTGLGMLTKETTEIFMAGLLTMVFLRGGWRNWRGLALFAIGLAVIGGPWYLEHRAQLGGLVSIHEADGGAGVGGFYVPPSSSSAYTFYFWNALNIQVMAPLTLSALIGTALALVGVLRRWPWRWAGEDLRPELLAGALVSYLGVSLITHKDPRYSIPALVYFAVLGTGWIAALHRPWRAPVMGLLGLALAANFIGVSAGIGSPIRYALPGGIASDALQRHVTLYSPDGWLRGGPEHDGDALGLLRGLHRYGITSVTFDGATSGEIDWNESGLQVRSIQAGIDPTQTWTPLDGGAHYAFVFLHTPTAGDPPPCGRLNNGSGVYAAVGNTTVPFGRMTLLCPSRRPAYYR
jgi:hypothetical protein